MRAHRSMMTPLGRGRGGPAGLTLLTASLLLGACGDDDTPTGIIPGQAVAKFCQELVRADQGIDLTLEFGQPPLARITTRSSSCQPPTGQPCTPIPVGLVPLRVLEGDKVLATRSVLLTNGSEYGIEPLIVDRRVVISVTKLPASRRCQSLGPLDTNDGGRTDAGDGGITDGSGDRPAGDASMGDAAAPGDAGPVTDAPSDDGPTPDAPGDAGGTPSDATSPTDAAAPGAGADVPND